MNTALVRKLDEVLFFTVKVAQAESKQPGNYTGSPTFAISESFSKKEKISII
jgi:hypothetical protein